MARLLYSLAVVALLPWALLHLAWRARRQPAYLRHWSERLGWFAPPRAQGPIWIHAVSVGETRAAQALVGELRKRHPGRPLLFSHMTPTGRDTGAALFGDGVERVYLPYDTPWAVGRFLDHFRPALGLVMETELWPNLIATCNRRQVPLLLVNARMSQRSADRYALLPGLTRQALAGLAAVAAQSEADAQRLSQLGARQVEVLGNLKFDIEPPPAQLALGRRLRAMIGSRRLFLCASTREGEEALILEAWKRCAPPTILLALVPRHPQRFDEVAGLIRERGFGLARRSENAGPSSDIAVWLGDSMGELFAWYAAADAAFIGGSLLEFGCQNLIEACAAGAPALIGPSTYNFAEAARMAIDAGAATPVRHAEELVDVALALLADPARRAAMAAAGLDFAARHRGATARTMALIERFSPAVR